MINADLDEIDITFLRNAPNLILRCITEQNLECAETILNGTKSYLKSPITRIPEGFRSMLESAFERNAQNKEELSDFQIILGQVFRPNEARFNSKATIHHQQQPAFGFFKYHDKPQYKQKTNLEIQQEMKKKEEE